MKPRCTLQRGFTLVEILVAMSIGIILLGGVIVVYSAQANTYKVVNSQAGTQNAENAITALVTPIIRAAGFVGCSTVLQPLTSNLNAGGPPPLGTLATPSMLFGYDANGTAGTGTLSITQLNTANDSNAANWTPNLDASLVSSVASGSDVLVMFGAIPGSQPVAVAAEKLNGTGLGTLSGSFRLWAMRASSSCSHCAGTGSLCPATGTNVVHLTGV